MVIDSSALIASVFDEPEAAALSAVIADHPYRCLSAFSLLEASVVLARRKGITAVGDDFPRTDLRTAAMLLPPREP